MMEFICPLVTVVLSAGTADNTLTKILAMAAELFTWLITQMGSLITFILGNPFILIPFIIMIVGLIVGYFGRVWGSVR